jgi:endonuclease/exonuclease/phosphatase family metal-dependent hydrolase
MTGGAPQAPELVPGVAYREAVEAALRHRTEESFRDSAFFRTHGAALERLLLVPRVEAPAGEREGGCAGAPDAISLRVLQWNIEKGKELSGIIRRLRDDPWMRAADLVLLNEVDAGTARGGNGDQARLLAAALGMHHAWLPTFIECTKGVGSDLDAEGENSLGLHGLAILSRWPIIAARGAVLPSCHDYFDFHEKRIGGRRGLYTLITTGERRFVAATTHLEVRRTPRCRAAQFAAFLRGLEASLAEWSRDGLLEAPGPADPREAAAGTTILGVPVLLGGDWNTNTFRRGGLAPAAAEFLRILGTPAGVLAAELARPFRREPLFSLLAADGFFVEGCNEAVPTAEQELASVEDLAMLPAWLASRIARAFGLSERVLRMRLDWMAVRGFQPQGSPVTLPPAGADRRALSDHAAIGVDLRFAAQRILRSAPSSSSSPGRPGQRWAPRRGSPRR